MKRYIGFAIALAFVSIGDYLIHVSHTMPAPRPVFDGHVTPAHRPLRQIDIQGHMQYGPRTACPAVYDAPNGDLRQCL
jgi:hypothetical protein